MTHAELHHLLRHRGRGTNGELPPPIIMQPARATEAAKVPQAESPLAVKFLDLWTIMEGPQLVPEYRFAPPRRWRFDFAHLPSRTAIELEGGVYGSQGRHVRPKGFQDDCEKYNQAALMLWVVVRFSGKMITREALGPIIERCAG